MSIKFIKMDDIDIEDVPFTLYFDSTLFSGAEKCIRELIQAWWDFGNVGGFGGSLPGDRTPSFNQNVAEWRIELDHLLNNSDFSLGRESFLIQTLIRGLENLELTFPYFYPGERLTITALVIGLHSSEILS